VRARRAARWAVLALLCAAALSQVTFAQSPSPDAADAASLPNPLVPKRADPQVLRHGDGWYYLMATAPEYDRLELRRARSIAGLSTAEPKVIWRKHEKGAMSRHIWAPELHFIDGRWFVYFGASMDDDPWKIRLFALENTSPDPMRGEWIERGQIRTHADGFTLDATSFEHRGTRYLLWAQQIPAIKTHATGIYISRMASPTTLAGSPVRLSQPEYAWEKVRHAVNEGPAVLVSHGRVFVAYSASGTGPEYCMGLLWADDDADLLDPRAWHKSPGPVFGSSVEHGIWGPGHGSFVSEPDGRVINVYHARNYRDIVGDPLKDTGRATRAQPLDFTAGGMPDFGRPLPETARP